MKYFSISELIASDTATVKHIDNTPSEAIKTHLNKLVDNLLDPLREQWTKYCTANKLGTGAIKVTSGYRCPALNKAVGGVATSAHTLGYAADIKPANGYQSKFEAFIANDFAKSGIKFDQIIIERSKSSKARWVHVGLRNRTMQQRMQCFNLTAK